MSPYASDTNTRTQLNVCTHVVKLFAHRDTFGRRKISGKTKNGGGKVLVCVNDMNAH